MVTVDSAPLELDGDGLFVPRVGEAPRPIVVCLLGSFRVLQAGRAVLVRGEKTVTLLGQLALRYAEGIPRDTLRDLLWTTSDAALAGEALHSRVHCLNKLLGALLGGAVPVVYVAGRYRLNSAAGVGVDVADFDALVAAGDWQARAGHQVAAVATYERAVALYHGDLCVGTDVYALLERERLRACYLTLLARLANYAYDKGDDAVCLHYALRLLASDPCREDAHRLIMRCYVRRGERAQALRQYRMCEAILRTEFATSPEAETVALFDQVRLDPRSI
jgi:DNA-binding SARP family transcriptional activator